MKVYIPNTSKQSIGGGWTFLKNFKKGFEEEYVVKHSAVGLSTDPLGIIKDEVVNTWQECDLVLITGATMTDRKEVIEAKEAGKKIIFRVDNIPRDSRNRGTAFSRMLDFAKMSDFIIFQSEWARDYAGWWFGDNGVDITNRSDIVYNGVEQDAFYENESTERKKNRYIYVQFNRDENKRMTEAFYLFHQAYREDKDAQLYLVGQFSPEMIENNFDFFANEKVIYLGVIEDREQLGDLYRETEYLLFPAFADASPNTVMEAIACGCKVIGVNEIGGTKELINIRGRSIEDMSNDYKIIFNKICQK